MQFYDIKCISYQITMFFKKTLVFLFFMVYTFIADKSYYFSMISSIKY